MLKKNKKEDVLSINDNTSTQDDKQASEKHENIKFQRINVDVEKPLKTLAVRHVNNSSHKNLAKYIEYLIKKDLDL